jgi:hypothetical protein
MSSSARPSSSVSPKVQAYRQEQSARGSAVARSIRDADLCAIGATPGVLAVIGGRHALTPHGAASVALWLYDTAARLGLADQCARLASLDTPAGRPKPGAHPFPARTLAAHEVARQVVAAALEEALERDALRGERPPTTPSTRPPYSLAVGLWLAGAVEGAELSAQAADLYEQSRATSTTTAASDDDAEQVRRAALSSAISLASEENPSPETQR